MTTRDALELLAGSLHRDTLLNPVLNAAVQELNINLDRYPYALSSKGEQLLRSFGVPVTGCGTRAHPHPIHKTLELHTYHQELPGLLSSRPTTVFFMKPEKFQRLAKSGLPFTTLVNQQLSSRDFVRYTTHSELRATTSCAYMDYALMFYTPAHILSLFTHSPHLHTLVATLIVPPESLITKSSFHPELYDFTIRGDTLIYTLEGHANGAYEQPMAAGDWLRCSDPVRSSHPDRLPPQLPCGPSSHRHHSIRGSPSGSPPRLRRP